MLNTLQVVDVDERYIAAKYSTIVDIDENTLLLNILPVLILMKDILVLNILQVVDINEKYIGIKYIINS